MRASPPCNPYTKTNRLLAALGPDDYQALMRGAEVVSLGVRKRLYSQGQPLDTIYFPLNCVVSVLIGVPEPDISVEVATIGNEGVAGSTIVLAAEGAERALGTNLVLIPGAAIRIDIQKFHREMRARPAVEMLMRRYLEALMRQVAVTAACNRLHEMRERCARWLLMTHDRAGTDSFTLTQELLSAMLGVRRATVSSALGSLKKAACIRYVRGRMTIVDRAGVESASCSCYEVIRREYQAVTGLFLKKAN